MSWNVYFAFERSTEECTWGRGTRACTRPAQFRVYIIEAGELLGLGQCLGAHCGEHAIRRALTLASLVSPDHVVMRFGSPPGGWGPSDPSTAPGTPTAKRDTK